MKLAIAWAEYLETHARRIYSMGTDISILAASTLAKKLKAQELAGGFSERDVQRRGWANLTENELVRRACQELEAAGWIRQRAKKRNFGGRPPGVMYDINPKLWQK